MNYLGEESTEMLDRVIFTKVKQEFGMGIIYFVFMNPECHIVKSAEVVNGVTIINEKIDVDCVMEHNGAIMIKTSITAYNVMMKETEEAGYVIIEKNEVIVNSV